MTSQGTPEAASLAGAMAEALAADGVVGLAVTIVDNSGIVRVKGIPVARLPDAVRDGIGGPPVLDAFGIDDSIAPIGSPIGDLRLRPDLGAVATLAGQPGWAWAPADRFTVAGDPYAGCQRGFARRMQERAAGEGLEVRMAFETEWVLDAGSGEELVPATTAPAYGMGRLIDISDLGRDLLAALATAGVDVQQLHPEYAPSQMEVSVSPMPPVGAADRVVLVRQTIRAVSARHGYRVSFSPAVTPGGVGNGAHVHLSVWRDGVNLLAERGGRLPPCRRGVGRRDPRRPPRPPRRHRPEPGQLPAAPAPALGGTLAVLGSGKPRGRRPPGGRIRHGRGRQRRGQGRRRQRQPVPDRRGAGRRRP